MIDFNELTERWAIAYKPMQHNPAADSLEKHFVVFTGSFPEARTLLANGGLKTPLVMLCADKEGDIIENLDHPEVHLYFLVKATDALHQAGDAATEEAYGHMNKFITYLHGYKYDKPKEAQGLMLDKMKYYSIDMKWEGWFGIALDMIGFKGINKCVNPEDYVTP